jgi:DNA-binding NarL/FixJ family response regulator
MGRTAILLADDHLLLRGTLGRLLDTQPDMVVVASVGTGDEAISEARRLLPDIVLMDIDMPGTTCFDAARAIQACSPESKIAFLSAFLSDRYIEQALALRAWGYMLKTAPPDLILQAIRKMASGITFYSPEVQSRMVLEHGSLRLIAEGVPRTSTLSQREVQVLHYIASGLAQKEIAEIMHLSGHTVHRHTTSIMNKLNTHDRVELARLAIREGLVEL